MNKNTTRKSQFYRHEKYGLLVRRPYCKYFYILHIAEHTSSIAISECAFTGEFSDDMIDPKITGTGSFQRKNEEFNNTGRTQFYLHKKHGLLRRYANAVNFIPSKRPIEDIPDTAFYYGEFKEEWFRDGRSRKSSVVHCECGKTVKRSESADGKCRACFCGYDSDEERSQLSIESHGGMRSSSAVESGISGIDCVVYK